MKKSFLILAGICSFAGGFVAGGKTLVNTVNAYKMAAGRNKDNMLVFNEWVSYINSGGKTEDFFHYKKYKRVMIYGGGYIGGRLQQALEKTDIEVAAIMDKIVPDDTRGLFIGIDAQIPDVDCIIITPVHFYDEICDRLKARTNVPIYSVKEIFI